ncbi:hypothetical protein O7047_04830 [Pseudenterobacter timonensis]|uniref:Uncharacterized protein n=1 Tax=Pseudenterobacter timonensis TaxID=1755099 RepID=A0AAE4DLA4_9ENTR|nr:hypothetical protein [Pseudenterobacter timonensis]MDR9889561.1 hypothetical protein [Pseudenterobacter timonensis]
MTELNKVKNAIQVLDGLSRSETDFNEADWSIDYKQDLDKELGNELANLKIELELLMSAIQRKDFVTAKCALVMIKVFSLNLSNFFLNIFEDIEKVGWSEQSHLPDIPENYQIPDHYNYRKK